MINASAINTYPINGTGKIAGKISLPLSIAVTEPKQLGIATLGLRIKAYQCARISLPFQITTHAPKGQLQLPLAVKTHAVGAVHCPLAVYVYNKTAFQQQASQWKIKLVLDGIDVSSNLTQTLRIELEEGTAKIAEFTLVPFSGPISITQWIGKSVSIYYQTLLSENLVFQGVVDEPIYDPTTRLTTFTCTDQLQERIAALTIQQLNQLISGHWSDVVFQAASDHWQYAQDLLSTIPSSLDIDRWNGLRVTPWAAKSEVDYRFTEDDIYYQSISVQLANRREIHNHSKIAIQYRFSRLKQREILFAYQYPLSFCDLLYRHATLPNIDMLQQSIDGTGWLLKGNVETTHLRESGWATCRSITFGFMISEQIRKHLFLSARFLLAKRFVQPVTEQFDVSVIAPQSIAQLGEITQTDAIGHETVIDTERFTNIEAYQTPREGSIMDTNGDFVLDADDRSALNQAIVTKLNQAKTAILKSHRNNMVSFTIAMNPQLERHHTIEVQAEQVRAKGKVKHIIHECDFNQGSCHTNLKIAISRTDNTSPISETILNPPTKAATIEAGEMINRINLPTHIGGRLQSPSYDESWNGYIGNEQLEPGAVLYPERFVIPTPAIDQALTPIEYRAAQQYRVSIPNELLFMSA